MDRYKYGRWAGIFMALGLVAGIFSVAPAVDSPEYLTGAAAQSNQVIWASVFQFLLSLCYVGVALVFYPILARYSTRLAIGYLGFRLIAVCLSLIGTLLLLSILSLSHSFVEMAPADTGSLESIGAVLKSSRDEVNHVFMVFMLCIGNIALYVMVMQKMAFPKWMPAWGIGGALLSIVASALVLFGLVDVITSAYLLLNAPTAVFEIVFSIWLLAKGIGPRN